MRFTEKKVRGIAQKIFREAILQSYDYKCAFCDFSFVFALEALHIIPWSNASKSERMDVRNGVLLCANHHKLFDSGWLTINDDYTINYCDPNEKKVPYSKYDSLLCTSFHKKKMHLPLEKRHWPNKRYLQKHRKTNA